MTKEELKKIANEALINNQLGVILWPSWSVWNHHAEDIIENKDFYNSITNSLQCNNHITISVTWNGFEMPGILTVPAKRLCKSENFLNEVLNICNKRLLNGPISLFPSNKILEV